MLIWIFFVFSLNIWHFFKSQWFSTDRSREENGSFSKRELYETQFSQCFKQIFLFFLNHYLVIGHASFVCSHSCASDTSHIYDKQLSTHKFLLDIFVVVFCTSLYPLKYSTPNPSLKTHSDVVTKQKTSNLQTV